MSSLTWKIILLRFLLWWLLFPQVGVVMALLALPSTSYVCDLVQGNFLTSLVWWDFLSTASNQNTHPCHAHGLYESGNTCSYYACWGSPFIFSVHFKEGSSLIYISTCSSDMFNGLYYWLSVEELAFLLSQSFLSPIHAFFGQGPYLGWRGRSASIHSALFLFLAIIASFAFMKFWAEWTSSAMVWGFCS